MSLEDLALVPLLRLGKENIRSSYELADELNISQRQIGFMVNRLRREGFAIGSKPSKGYYIISNEDELDETLEHINVRKKGIDNTINALLDACTHVTKEA